MSLLPGQIIPQSIPIGKTANGDMVSIDHNWWLFFYNLALGTLSPTPGGTAVSDMEKILLNEIDSRVNDTTGGSSPPPSSSGFDEVLGLLTMGMRG